MGLNAEVLRASLELVAAREPLITRRFYEILFARYPRVRSLFGRNTPEKQQKMLQQAIVAVIDHLDDAGWLRQTLHGLGATHAGYGVTHEMYGWVGECLLATLAELAGDAWTEEVERAWTDAYEAIAGLMLEGAASVEAVAKGA